MKIAIRAEGSTDIGVLAYDGAFQKGPMLILLEKLDCYQTLLAKLGFDEGLKIDDFIQWEYVHKDEIKNSANARRKMVFRSKKDHGFNGVKGFYKNSEAFACIAREKGADIAVFFVDTDKDFSEERYKQVKAGLSVHHYDKTGVPMIPVKISEAWLMCCLSQYQNCADHERATTDKQSPDYPKNVCDTSGNSRHEIAENCDPNHIDMPSFNLFKKDFSDAVNGYLPMTCQED
jgi:hypothetical protein